MLTRLSLRVEIWASARASNFEPRSRTRTRYFEVPRTLATTSPALAVIKVTRPLTKYDWPRERTASLKFRALSGQSPLSVPAWDGLCNHLVNDDMQAKYCKLSEHEFA